MNELIGLIGGALFAAGCVPVALKAVWTGRSVDTPLSTMWLLFTALIFYCYYLFHAFGPQLPFWFLMIELVCWGTALWYHYFPRRTLEQVAEQAKINRMMDECGSKCAHGYEFSDDCPMCRYEPGGRH